MSQAATDSATLVQSWDSKPSKEEELQGASLSSDDNIQIRRGSPEELPGGAAKRTTSLRTRSGVSPCPMWKRSIDVVGSFVGLLVLAPFLCAVAVYIKCVSRGPVLFRQLRYGLDGRPFEVWKFRTIEVSDEFDQHHSHVADLMASNRPLQKRDHELDVIPGGALFRNLGIDELPQLVNVLIGEMSLVGPQARCRAFPAIRGLASPAIRRLAWYYRALASVRQEPNNIHRDDVSRRGIRSPPQSLARCANHTFDDSGTRVGLKRLGAQAADTRSSQANGWLAQS